MLRQSFESRLMTYEERKDCSYSRKDVLRFMFSKRLKNQLILRNIIKAFLLPQYGVRAFTREPRSHSNPTILPRFDDRCCGDLLEPQRWRTFMWEVMGICRIMSSQELLLPYLVRIYLPYHLRKPSNHRIQGKCAFSAPDLVEMFW